MCRTTLPESDTCVRPWVTFEDSVTYVPFVEKHAAARMSMAACVMMGIGCRSVRGTAGGLPWCITSRAHVPFVRKLQGLGEACDQRQPPCASAGSIPGPIADGNSKWAPAGWWVIITRNLCAFCDVSGWYFRISNRRICGRNALGLSSSGPLLMPQSRVWNDKEASCLRQRQRLARGNKGARH